jgi:hypothetical protein
VAFAKLLGYKNYEDLYADFVDSAGSATGPLGLKKWLTEKVLGKGTVTVDAPTPTPAAPSLSTSSKFKDVTGPPKGSPALPFTDADIGTKVHDPTPMVKSTYSYAHQGGKVEVAFVKIPGTNLSNLVMKAEDGDWYLLKEATPFGLSKEDVVVFIDYLKGTA